MSTGYDYTRGDPVPVEENPDDFQLGDVSNASDRDADRIAAENGFRNVPPGRHVLVVAGFRGMPESDYYHVLVAGKPSGFNAYRVKVKLCLPDDPRATVEDTFLLPPEDAREQVAYFNGVPQDKPNSNPGFQANKFVHFIDRLGFPFPAGGKLPEAARRLGNWKGRRVVAEVTPGKPFVNREGKTQDGFPNVKLFSYEVAPAGGNGPALAPAAQVGLRPVVSAAARPATRPIPAGQPSGLDDI